MRHDSTGLVPVGRMTAARWAFAVRIGPNHPAAKSRSLHRHEAGGGAPQLNLKLETETRIHGVLSCVTVNSAVLPLLRAVPRSWSVISPLPATLGDSSGNWIFGIAKLVE